MTLDEARRVLGVGPEEDPVERLEEFAAARERLADLVRQSPNDTLAVRYQDGLQEFDRALAAVKEEIERRRQEKLRSVIALVPGSVSGKQVSNKREGFLDEPVPPAFSHGRRTVTPGKGVEPGKVEPPTAPVVPSTKARPVDRGKRLRYSLYAVLFLVVGGVGGAWLYLWMEEDRALRQEQEVSFLEGLGAKLVEGRRWDEAMKAYRRIEDLSPGSEVAVLGRRSIEVGMREEQQQFVGYWSGEALSAFEAGRFEDAREAADKVLDRYPNEKEVLALSERIEAAHRVKLRQVWEERIRAAIDEREWQQSEELMRGLAEELPGSELVGILRKEIDAGKERELREHQRAGELLAAARLRDQGNFDPQVLDWMREALALDPENGEIREFYEKIASYTRTIRVPEDLPTLAEALSGARDRDRIVLGEGTFAGGVAINAAVQLEGAGEGKTVLENAATDGPVITFGPGAKGATAAGLVFRKTGFDASETRFPGVQLRGAEVSFSDCHFDSASGHGLEVIEGGLGSALRCHFTGNGWDGAAAHGEGSRLECRESTAEKNFAHGFEIWDGAVAKLIDCVSKRNVRAGILVDSVADGIQLEGNEVFGNREYGIVLAAGASGTVRGNSCYGNMRGGLVVRFAAISMVVEKNQIEENDGPGLILEQGLREDIFADNTTRSNSGGNQVVGAKFDSGE